jgi:hypothetical protein
LLYYLKTKNYTPRGGFLSIVGFETVVLSVPPRFSLTKALPLFSLKNNHQISQISYQKPHEKAAETDAEKHLLFG